MNKYKCTFILILSLYREIVCYRFTKLVSSTKLFSDKSNNLSLLEQAKARIAQREDDFNGLTDVQEDLSVKFNREDPPKEEKEKMVKLKLQQQSQEISNNPTSTYGSLSLDDLRSRMKANEPQINRSKKDLPQRLEDLNGIKPEKPLQFSVVAALMAYIGWQITVYMTAHFGVQFLDSEFYPIQRFTIVARNIIIGISTIGTTFSAIISLGLIALSVRVFTGVAKGELDPNLDTSVSDNDMNKKDENRVRTVQDAINMIKK